jgi:hypothetical protein
MRLPTHLSVLALSLTTAAAPAFLAGCAGTSTGDGDVGDGDGDVGDGDGDVAGDGDGDIGDGDASPDHAFVSQDALIAAVSTLASDDLEGRDEGSSGSQVARAWLIGELEACGIGPGNGDSYTQAITTGDGTNILGLIEGSDPAVADRTIVLSAHYDHLGVLQGNIYNGAMDNAAGVAVALRVACALADTPPARSVVIAFWDAEEPPTFLTDAMGSEFFGAHPTIPLEDVDVAIALDLMGGGLWPGYQAHVTFGAELSPEVMAAYDSVTPPEGLETYRAGLHLFEERPTGHLPLSDYDAFRNRDVPVMFFTDGTNKSYHQPHDDVSSLDPAKMAKEASFLLDVMWALGQAETTPAFLAGGKDHLADARVVHQLLTDAVADGGMVDALNLSGGSQSALEGDLAAVTDVLTRLEGEQQASSQDLATLRRGLQRCQCLAGTDYAELICQFL